MIPQQKQNSGKDIQQTKSKFVFQPQQAVSSFKNLSLKVIVVNLTKVNNS